MVHSTLISALPTQTTSGQARKSAFDSIEVDVAPTSVVGYQSKGQVLMIGKRVQVARALSRLADSGLKCHTLVTESDTEDHEQAEPVRIDFQSDQYEVSGHLGAFQVIATAGERRTDLGLYVGFEKGHFDIVVECSPRPSVVAEVLPPGYYWIDDNDAHTTQLDGVLSEIPDLVGNFEKPKYFNYDPDICVHGRSGIVACTRCIDACPTDAISSLIETIEVNSHLCQGAGTCSTACPTGAITYAYPPAANLLEVVRQLLRGYRQADGVQPTLLFYDIENGAPLVEAVLADMNENVLPIEVEEVGSVGIDVCLSALAYGAVNVKILLTAKTPKRVRRELNAQLEVLHALLESLGISNHVAALLDAPLSASALKTAQGTTTVGTPASYIPSGNKRTDIRTALEHLHESVAERPTVTTLPLHAAFGEIHVDTETCTLCMGCVSVCPAAALESGDDSPKLSFIEHNCVQCGLCETACPEQSITRSPRYLFDTDERMRSRKLNEDAPFHCQMCGKPFATQAMLSKMREKLKGHWMFEKNPQAIKRLEMCEDCRVKDMFAEEGGFDKSKL